MGKREKKRLEKRRREQEEREREEREREERERREREERERREREMMDERRRPIKATMALAIGSLVYYHCAYRNSSFVTLLADVFIVILCSLAVSGLFSRQMNIQSVLFALSFPFPFPFPFPPIASSLGLGFLFC